MSTRLEALDNSPKPIKNKLFCVRKFDPACEKFIRNIQCEEYIVGCKFAVSYKVEKVNQQKLMLKMYAL